MGLDAFVRCRCFEEGKLKPGPIPFEDLYIDDEDYISSKLLDQKRKELSSEQFRERYGDLESDFLDWMDSACEHEYGEYGFTEDTLYFHQLKPSRTFYADHFCQIPADDYEQTQKVVVFCDNPNSCESNFRMTLPGPIDSELDNSVLRSFSVQKTTLDFKETGHFWRLNKIRNLLVASIETKHPIVWC